MNVSSDHFLIVRYFWPLFLASLATPIKQRKCHSLQLGRKKSDQTNYYLTDAAINSFVPISKVSHVKDLGVYIDENLNF